jgi:hypothetical protein
MSSLSFFAVGEIELKKSELLFENKIFSETGYDVSAKHLKSKKITKENKYFFKYNFLDFTGKRFKRGKESSFTAICVFFFSFATCRP